MPAIYDEIARMGLTEIGKCIINCSGKREENREGIQGQFSNVQEWLMGIRIEIY